MELELIKQVDPEIATAIENEIKRQAGGLELIASENFTSPAVMAAQGSVLTNKYAEGYPGKRYYGGCQYIDVAEDLARKRVCALFGAEHANVQPHSGAQANTAVYFSVLKPGDLVMGMNLAHGGHLTHGSKINISGRYYNFVSYGVDEDSGYIDYEQVRQRARETRPKMIVAGASSYPRQIDFTAFGEIAREVGAKLMVDMAHIAGLVAADLHPSPVPQADFVTSTTHKTLRGPRGGFILTRAEYAREIDKAVFPGIQGGPLEHVIAAKAVAFKEAMDPSFKNYQQQVVRNARVLGESLSNFGFQLVSGGTDNHLLLIDVRNKGITGQQAETMLDEVGITVNKNVIPADPQPPMVTSGIRVGTPAVTTRGFQEEDMQSIAQAFDLVLSSRGEESKKKQARNLVRDLCNRYPLQY